MSNGDYNFLKGLILVDTGRVKLPKVKNPKGETLRIMANGEVYPGQELVDRYNLEYADRGGRTGNGIDVIDSKEWGLDIFNDKSKMLLMGFTSKNNPKVDLFGQCRYNEDNSPKASVMTQGTTCEKLLSIVKELGWLTPDQKYCDLVFLTEYPVKSENGISLIPKVVERGTTKGDRTYQRRENEIFYPVVTIEEYNNVTGNTTSTIVEVEEQEVEPVKVYQQATIQTKIDEKKALTSDEMAQFIAANSTTDLAVYTLSGDDTPF